MTTKKVDMVVDLQYGSTGKGLICGYLAMKNKYDVVVNANMPNAGHTFIDHKGNKMMHKVLPNGVVSPNCKVALIGPGSIFSVEQLKKEIETALGFGYMKNVAVMIHPNAVALAPWHPLEEAKLGVIGSTQQGSAAAMIEKIMRNPDEPVTMRNYRGDLPTQTAVVSNARYNEIIDDAESILAEGAQGFSLGINEQFYPYCTSRDCGPARFMSDMAIPLPMLRKVIGTARTYPIRVGGTSGGCYPDQKETSWAELGIPEERTTVTNRVRRVFTFSEMQIKDAMRSMCPDEVFLNFCNYVPLRGDLDKIFGAFGGKVQYSGWGPHIRDVHDYDGALEIDDE